MNLYEKYEMTILVFVFFVPMRQLRFCMQG